MSSYKPGPTGVGTAVAVGVAILVGVHVAVAVALGVAVGGSCPDVYFLRIRGR
jgi:hypothetical protein